MGVHPLDDTEMSITGLARILIMYWSIGELTGHARVVDRLSSASFWASEAHTSARRASGYPDESAATLGRPLRLRTFAASIAATGAASSGRSTRARASACAGASTRPRIGREEGLSHIAAPGVRSGD